MKPISHWYLEEYNDTWKIIDFIVFHHYSNEDTSSILRMTREACAKVKVPKMTYEEMERQEPSSSGWVTVGLVGKYNLMDINRFEISLFMGVEYHWVDFKDNQTEPNHVKANMGPLGLIGAEIRFWHWLSQSQIKFRWLLNEVSWLICRRHPGDTIIFFLLAISLYLGVEIEVWVQLSQDSTFTLYKNLKFYFPGLRNLHLDLILV